jgi:hypothetical protein
MMPNATQGLRKDGTAPCNKCRFKMLALLKRLSIHLTGAWDTGNGNLVDTFDHVIERVGRVTNVADFIWTKHMRKQSIKNRGGGGWGWKRGLQIAHIYNHVSIVPDHAVLSQTDKRTYRCSGRRPL